jgi:hypothetical protein
MAFLPPQGVGLQAVIIIVEKDTPAELLTRVMQAKPVKNKIPGTDQVLPEWVRCYILV